MVLSQSVLACQPSHTSPRITHIGPSISVQHVGPCIYWPPALPCWLIYRSSHIGNRLSYIDPRKPAFTHTVPRIFGIGPHILALACRFLTRIRIGSMWSSRLSFIGSHISAFTYRLSHIGSRISVLVYRSSHIYSTYRLSISPRLSVLIYLPSNICP